MLSCCEIFILLPWCCCCCFATVDRRCICEIWYIMSTLTGFRQTINFVNHLMSAARLRSLLIAMRCSARNYYRIDNYFFSLHTVVEIWCKRCCNITDSSNCRPTNVFHPRDALSAICPIALPKCLTEAFYLASFKSQDGIAYETPLRPCVPWSTSSEQQILFRYDLQGGFLASAQNPTSSSILSSPDVITVILLLPISLLHHSFCKTWVNMVTSNLWTVLLSCASIASSQIGECSL